MRHLRIGSVALAATCLAPLLPAQDVSLSAVAVNGFSARINGQQSLWPALPRGASLDGGYAGVTLASSPARANVNVTIDASDPHALLYRIDEVASITCSPFAPAGNVSVATGPHRTRVTLSAAVPVRAVVEVVATSATGGIVEVDIGDDGTVELAGGAGRFPVAFGPRSLDIGTVTTTGAAINCSGGVAFASSSAGVSLSIVPDTLCAVSPAGAGCGQGLTFRAAPTFTGELELVLGGAAPGDVGGVLIGLQPAAFALPQPPGCTVHLVPLVAVPVPLGAGTGALRFRLAPVLPVDFLMQGVAFDPATSRLVLGPADRLTCP